MEIQQEHAVVGTFTLAMASVAWYMIKDWKRTWEERVTNRLNDHSDRLNRHAEKHNEHDVNHATLTADLEHIKDTTKTISRDVKSLLVQNGKRSSG